MKFHSEVSHGLFKVQVVKETRVDLTPPIVDTYISMFCGYVQV